MFRLIPESLKALPVLAAVASFALIAAPAPTLADEPAPVPVPEETEVPDPSNAPPEVDEERLFSLSEVSFFFNELATSGQGFEQLEQLRSLNGATFSAN